MDSSRPARIVLLAALVVAAALGLVVLGRSGSSRAGGRPAATATSRPNGSTTTGAPTTRPDPTTTTTTPPGGEPDYPLASVQLTVSAHNNYGAPVSIPTPIWYPDAPGAGPFPLVVFSPGYQIAPSAYSALIQAWGAAGYVVAEPSYPDTAPGSPQIEYDMVNHPGELSQVISTLLADSAGGSGPLAGLIDPNEIAAAGQSDGGDVSLAAAANTCCLDRRIKAAVILSGAEATLFGGSYYTGTGNPPLLAVQGDADTVNAPPCSAQLYDGAAPPRYYLELPGATHLSAYTGTGPQFNVVTEVTTAFLDAYLKDMPSRLTSMQTLAQTSGVSRLFSGSAEVPVVGGCLGAPGGG